MGWCEDVNFVKVVRGILLLKLFLWAKEEKRRKIFFLYAPKPRFYLHHLHKFTKRAIFGRTFYF